MPRVDGLAVGPEGATRKGGNALFGQIAPSALRAEKRETHDFCVTGGIQQLADGEFFASNERCFPPMMASSQARQAARSRPVVLTIAGSDNSAGAGAQADLKTFSYFGCYGLTTITCVVAEVPGKVAAIQAIRPAIIAEQIALSFKAFPVAAAKTGMLYSASIVEAVAEVLAARKTKLVVDPVMVASSGDPLLKKSAITAYQKALFPNAVLVTPNLDELKILAGRDIRNLNEMKDAGGFLVEKYGCAFLLKGGHLRGKIALDVLVTTKGFEEFAAPFVVGIETHGTGCTYSAAVAANLALGSSLSKAVSAAKDYVTRAIEKSLRWEKTHALEHFPQPLNP